MAVPMAVKLEYGHKHASGAVCEVPLFELGLSPLVVQYHAFDYFTSPQAAQLTQISYQNPVPKPTSKPCLPTDLITTTRSRNTPLNIVIGRGSQFLKPYDRSC